MIKFNITHQESYSRGQLLIRSFFGLIYIILPHFFLIYFYAIWVFLVQIAAWWIILFTGKTPDFYYTTTLGFYRWGIRVMARVANLADGYPAFGPNGTDDKTILDFPHVHIGRGQLLLRSFFGWLYVAIPHVLCLYVRMIATYVLMFLAWWAVLFTGKYPAGWHKFNVGTFRWGLRVYLYLGFLSMTYPPFNGASEEMEEADKPFDQI